MLRFILSVLMTIVNAVKYFLARPIINGGTVFLGRVFKELQWTRLGESRFSFYRQMYSENARNRDGAVKYRATWSRSKLLVTDSKLAKRVCGRFLDRPASGYVEDDRFTQSLFNLNGSEWARRRKLLSRSAFSFRSMALALPVMYGCARTVASEISDGGETDTMRLSRAYVWSAFCRCIFGRHGNDALARATESLRHADTQRFGLASDDHTYASASHRFRQFIQRSRQTATASQSTFLKEFDGLSESFPDQWNDDDTDAHCAMFFTGGYTSTASAIAFAMYEIARDGSVQEELRNEIARTAGPGDASDQSVLQSCQYLDRVVKEVLRKYPPFASLSRSCSDGITPTREPDDMLSAVPRGTPVVVPVSGLHYDAAFFPDPDAFDPNRFTEPGERTSYMPFGSGPRRCIGEKFATLMIKIFIVAILESYRLTLPETYSLPRFTPRKFTTSVDRMTIIFTNI